MSNNDQINEATFHPRLWTRFWSMTWPYWKSEERKSAWGLLIGLLLLAASVTGLEVVISYVGNYFTTALSTRQIHAFYHWMLIYGLVFVVATPISTFYAYIQSKLGINWRRWLADRLLTRYFQNRAYYAVNLRSNVDNPDQRLTQDADAFTSSSVGFLVAIFQSILTIGAFVGVLLTISRLLTGVLVLYTIAGTLIALLFGRRLVTLNFQQQRREANFRYGLVRVRDNTEAIAFYRGEPAEEGQAKSLLLAAVRNFNALIIWQRNLGFFTNSYNYLIIVLPYVVVAPLYFAHKIPFGAVTQAGYAFSRILSAASLVVNSFQDITAFAATVDRLSNFHEALSEPVEPPVGERIEVQRSSELHLEDLTLETPDGERVLIDDLTVQASQEGGLLIVGPSGAGKSSLLRAIAGLWERGSGRIERPDSGQMQFLPQAPYLVQGSLRRQLLYPRQEAYASDDTLQAVLEQVSLPELAARVGGLDAERDWDTLLSLGERQRLAFARLLLARPQYAVLDEATSALDAPNEQRLYESLRAVCPFYVSVGHNPSLRRYHRRVLELDGATHWSLGPSAEYREREAQ